MNRVIFFNDFLIIHFYTKWCPTVPFFNIYDLFFTY